MPAELGGENAGRRFPVVPAAGWVDTLTPTRATATHSLEPVATNPERGDRDSA